MKSSLKTHCCFLWKRGMEDMMFIFCPWIGVTVSNKRNDILCFNTKDTNSHHFPILCQRVCVKTHCFIRILRPWLDLENLICKAVGRSSCSCCPSLNHVLYDPLWPQKTNYLKLGKIIPTDRQRHKFYAVILPLSYTLWDKINSGKQEQLVNRTRLIPLTQQNSSLLLMTELTE